MPDISTVATIVSMIADGNGIIDSLCSRFKSKSDPEAITKLIGLQSILVSLQSRLLDLEREKFDALNQVRLIQEKCVYRSKLVRRESYYEFPEPVEGYGKGPFCLRCTDERDMPVGVPVDMNGHFKCSSCQSEGWIASKEAEHYARMRAFNEAQNQKLKRQRDY